MVQENRQSVFLTTLAQTVGRKLAQKLGAGFCRNSWSTNKSGAKNLKKLWAFK
jgi:hypothetical protein